MYAKAIIVALLSLSLSASAIPAAKNDATCGTAIKTVTVTATAAAAASTSVAAAANASKGSKGNTGKSSTGKTSTSTGKGGNNASTGSTASSSTGTAAASTGKGNNAAASAQTSLTIDPSNIFDFSLTGQETPTAGQEASITSQNNFINFCLTTGKTKTNGKQIVEGSCNQTPMGVIAAKALMPSSKFVFPANGGTVAANTNFTVRMAISNLETGHFTNPDSTFHMAPQQVNAQGLIKGHSHITIEQLSSLSQATPTDPTKFVFFKGLNGAAVNGELSVLVAGGLPAGTYRIASINSAANHQPALVAVAQRGALDDMAYFTVTAAAATGGNNAATGKTGTTGKTGKGNNAAKGSGKFGGKFFGKASGKSRRSD